jgi:hypothetical protein
MKACSSRLFVAVLVAFGLALVAALVPAPAHASDHDDTPLLKDNGRHDARVTDLYAFVRGDRLVLIVTTNPAIPAEVTQYLFPDDLQLSIYLDRNSKVDFDDAAANATYGGKVRTPDKIREDVVFDVSFKDGKPYLEIEGLGRKAQRSVRMFTGLRDDPFIRGPRIGRNVAAVVIDVPLDVVLRGTRPLLVWAGTSVPEVDGPIADLGARALRSQLAENLALNDVHPSLHLSQLGLAPDVVILDPSRPIAFPNGRELIDDVVDLVGDPRLLTTDAPFPSANDAPFLAEFPFLAPPHLLP